MNSFNHYSLGSVGDWMYSTLCGIALDPAVPGYKHIIISPRFGDGITWAKAKVASVHGDIETSWKLKGKKLTLDVVVPANTTATITLPPCSGLSTPSHTNITGGVTFDTASGRYHYEATLS
jgi:alpha-L-rhamnosidase